MSRALRDKWRSGVFDGSEFDPEIKTGRFEGFDRIKKGPYDLLFRALKSCGLDERL